MVFRLKRLRCYLVLTGTPLQCIYETLEHLFNFGLWEEELLFGIVSYGRPLMEFMEVWADERERERV